MPVLSVSCVGSPNQCLIQVILYFDLCAEKLCPTLNVSIVRNLSCRQLPCPLRQDDFVCNGMRIRPLQCLTSENHFLASSNTGVEVVSSSYQ